MYAMALSHTRCPSLNYLVASYHNTNSFDIAKFDWTWLWEDISLPGSQRTPRTGVQSCPPSIETVSSVVQVSLPTRFPMLSLDFKFNQILSKTNS